MIVIIASLTKKELQIISKLIENGNITAKTLSEKSNTSPQSMSRYIKNLKRKGFIQTQKKGYSKKISLAETHHALLLREQLLTNKHMNLSPITNTGIQILGTINCLNLKTWEEIMEHADVSYRALRPKMSQFKSIGLVIKNDNYEINSRFSILKEFVSSYIEYLYAQKVKKQAQDAQIKWCCGKTCIFETEKKLDLQQTGMSAFPNYGALFFSTRNLYILSSKTKLRFENHVINHILSEQKQNSLPLLITWKLNEDKIDISYLKKQAYLYKIPEIVDNIINYLQTEGKRKPEYLPEWNDFIMKYRDYEYEH